MLQYTHASLRAAAPTAVAPAPCRGRVSASRRPLVASHEVSQSAHQHLWYQPPTNVFARRSQRCGAGPSPQSTSTAVEQLAKQLRGLEQERDDAISIAENCAKTAVKLNEMQGLLDDLAVSKVREGDEAGAKSVLQERNSLKDIVEKNSAKAQANFALAGKLAEKIGDLQNRILELTAPPATSSSSSSSSSYSYSPSSSASYSSSSGSRMPPGYSTSAAAANSPLTSGYVPAWQKSLMEAKARLAAQEEEAAKLGRLARLDAEASIAAAKQRIAAERSGSGESIVDARDRLRRTAEESIAEAQERLRRQDAEIIEYCRRIVARYRRGEYVAEEEMEFAFKQLEKRLL